MNRFKRLILHRERSDNGESSSGIFQYTPLKTASNFRILRLQKKFRDSNKEYTDLPLRESLIEASLESHPEYYALSYTWGDPNLCEKIVIDGKPLKITANCAPALRRMLRGKFSKAIWVDSICINQADTPEALKERGGQVAMMDEIYRRAVQVNVHLGDGDEASDVACEALKSLSVAFLAARIPGPGQEACRAKYERLADEVLTPTSEYPYGKLHGIFRLPWFRRTWAIQEVALAQKAMFYCGKHLMRLEMMVVGADFTRLPYSKLDSIASARHWRAYLEYHDALKEFIRRREEGEPTLNPGSLLGVLMVPALTLEATRPEDKIFALYGICKRLGFQLPAPDYRKPLAVVYTEAARAVLHYDQNLGLLSAAMESSGCADELPSWVPNFSGCIRRWSPSSPPHVSISERENPKISGLTKCQYLLEPDGIDLKVKDRRLDTICAVGQPWKTDAFTTLLGDSPTQTGQFAESLVNCIGSWLDIIQGRSDSPRGKLAIELLVRVLADNVEDQYPAVPTEDMIRYLSVLVAMSGSENNVLYLTLAGLVDGTSSPQQGDVLALFGGLERAIRRIGGSSWKTLFRTTRDYLGTGSHSVRAGDIVVVFHGRPTAGIVRPCTSGFKYVCPAYVDGIMNGEFWNAGSASDDEWIVLV